MLSFALTNFGSRTSEKGCVHIRQASVQSDMVAV
jgi:hypothetical protein